MTKVDIAGSLVLALEPEPEAAVEGYLNVRDIALNSFKLSHHHGPSVQKTDGSHSVQEVYSGSGRAALGFLLGFLIEYCCLSRIVRIHS